MRLLRWPVASAGGYGAPSHVLLGAVPRRERMDRGERQTRGDETSRGGTARSRAEEAARRGEREYQRALAAGGAVAANARWERLYDETNGKYGGRYGLCQWEDEDDDGNYEGRCCTRRTADVYCLRHNRQLARETAKRRRESEDSASRDDGL